MLNDGEETSFDGRMPQSLPPCWRNRGTFWCKIMFRRQPSVFIQLSRISKDNACKTSICITNVMVQPSIKQRMTHISILLKTRKANGLKSLRMITPYGGNKNGQIPPTLGVSCRYFSHSGTILRKQQ